VVKFVNQIIREAIAERATDIHGRTAGKTIAYSYRHRRHLHEVAVPRTARLQSAIISRLKVMSHMDIAERRLPRTADDLLAGNVEIDFCASRRFQLSTASQSVLRLLSRGEQQFNFDRLDLGDKKRKLFGIPHPTETELSCSRVSGCGKSTSLYCFLKQHQFVQRRIITIEEPVEYRIPGVSQST